MSQPGSCLVMSGRVALPLVVVAAMACTKKKAATVVEQSCPPAAAPSPTGEDLFLDVTRAAGIGFRHRIPDGRLSNLVEGLGSGAAMADLDGDGRLDLVFLAFAPDRDLSPCDADPESFTPAVYRNTGHGTFEDVTARSGLRAGDFSLALAVGDYDNDGDEDLFVANAGPDRLYRNRGDGTFEEVGAKAGVADPALGAAATFFDFDRDGWLDLYVGNYLRFDPRYTLHYDPDAYAGPLAYDPEKSRLFRNRGDGTFEDVSERAGIAGLAGRDMSAAAADLDLDGDDDLYVATDATAHYLLRNDGHGRFADDAERAGVAYGLNGDSTSAMAIDVADVDHDGRFDLAVSDVSYGALYMGRPDGEYVDAVVTSGLARLCGQYVGWGQCFVDYDDDGDVDLFRVNGDLHHVVGWQDLLLKNDGAGHFSDASLASGRYFQRRECGRGACTGDYDDDGDVDLLVTCLDGPPILLRNDSPPTAAWLTLELEGRRSNRDAIGAIVRVEAGGRSQLAVARCPTGYLSCGDRRLHFGLGSAAEVDRLTIRWPSGLEQTLEHVATRQELHLIEPADGPRKAGG